MNPVLEFFADRQDLLFVALVALEITVVAILALVAVRLTRRDAATRYGLGLAALILIALAAPATWMMQNAGWTTLAWERMILIDPNFTPIEIAEQVRQPLPLWMWIWGVGAGLVLARVGLGFVRVHLLRRDSIQLERLSGKVAVYATDDAGPAVVGALRPAVLMPRKLLDALSDEEIQDVLAHEFAHVAHRHLIAALFQRFLAAVYWPHPLIHLLNRELVVAREEMCDNAVLRSAGAARYARVLLRVAECRLQPRQFSASLGLFGPSTSLEKRVKSLLDPNRRIESNMNKSKIVVACSTLALGMAAVAGARIQTQVVVPVNQDRAAQLSVPTVIVEQVAPIRAKPVVIPGRAKKATMKKKVKVVAKAPVKMGVPLVVAPGVAVPIQVAPLAPVPVTAPAQAVAPLAGAPSLPAPAPVQVPGGAATPAVAPTPVQSFHGIATTVPSSAYVGQVTSSSAKRDDLDTYRSMKGEDRPDFLTHPLKFGTPSKPAQTRSLPSSNSRRSIQGQLKLSTVKAGQVFTTDRLSLAKAYEAKATNFKLDTVKVKASLVEGKVSRLLEERIIVKPDLDKAVVYQLKYNPETKKWELVPLTTPK